MRKKSVRERMRKRARLCRRVFRKQAKEKSDTLGRVTGKQSMSEVVAECSTIALGCSGIAAECSEIVAECSEMVAECSEVAAEAKCPKVAAEKQNAL
eukprot:2909214-Pleurochrysis_carterae.AAC.1